MIEHKPIALGLDTIVCGGHRLPICNVADEFVVVVGGRARTGWPPQKLNGSHPIDQLRQKRERTACAWLSGRICLWENQLWSDDQRPAPTDDADHLNSSAFVGDTQTQVFGGSIQSGSTPAHALHETFHAFPDIHTNRDATKSGTQTPQNPGSMPSTRAA